MIRRSMSRSKKISNGVKGSGRNGRLPGMKRLPIAASQSHCGTPKSRVASTAAPMSRYNSLVLPSPTQEPSSAAKGSARAIVAHTMIRGAEKVFLMARIGQKESSASSS